MLAPWQSAQQTGGHRKGRTLEIAQSSRCFIPFSGKPCFGECETCDIFQESDSTENDNGTDYER
jgi:hypothetical protein